MPLSSILTNQWAETGYKNTFADHMPTEGGWQLFERAIFGHCQCEIAKSHATEETTNE